VLGLLVLSLSSPVRRPSYASSGWGADRSYRGDIHRGMDLRAAIGDPALAAAGGEVIVAAYGSETAGNWAAIRHASGLVTRYLHLSAIHVSVGQRVAGGQIIGLTGNTGTSAGPHLHFDAILPSSSLWLYTTTWGTPSGGFGDEVLGLGVKVPIEPMLPVDQYSELVVSQAKEYGLSLHGATNWGLVAGVGMAAVGVYLLVS
jgi:murein DD-endopeptidase MepM/ murein hydrolase activator NlpD